MISENVKKWIIKALEDIKTIEHEFNFPEDEVVTSTVCFHAQQAVEKLLKAYLVTKGVDFGKTHNLNLLLKLCSEKDGDFMKLNVGKLNFYSVDVRYPDSFYPPTLKKPGIILKMP